MSGTYSIIHSTQTAQVDATKTIRFSFSINMNNDIFYTGLYTRNESTYSSNYSNDIESIEQTGIINLLDARKIIRDHPNMTKAQLSNIIDQLTIQCIEHISKQKLSDKNIMFSATYVPTI